MSSQQVENETADVSSSSPSSSSSLVHLRGCDAFPKHVLSRPLECDGIDVDGSSAAAAAAASSFPLLPGEYLIHVGHAGTSVIALSNYRLLLHRSMDCQPGQLGKDTEGQGIVNVPLGLLEQIECRDIFFLHVICKDAKRIRCMFDTNEASLEWCKRLVSAVAPPKRIEDVLAFAHYAWMHEDNIDLHQTLADAAFPRGLWNSTATEGRSRDSVRRKFFEDEVRRMGFESNPAWRITSVNEDFALCPSYPRELIVPASVKDEDLKKVAQFRSSQRFPVIVWRHQENGCVIARCSQPEVGFLSYREAKDEALVQAIGIACALDSCNGLIASNDLPLEEDTDSDGVTTNYVGRGAAIVPTVLIMDARSYAAAVANKLKGGGSECSEYYPNCEVQFMGLANIHAIRKSFQSVRTLCVAYSDHPYWFSGLENTKWLHHIGGLLRSAVIVASAVDRDRRPVLVHCSDGWDRTPQIVALAQLLLDPHFRTFDGFQILVEREWLDFGHKFGDRCGHSVGVEDVNERCPVFLQWLDCVHQLLTQFPCAFEFNANYLIKLSHHVYSCLYGTFLCNSEQERTRHDVRLLTHSVWALLRYNHTRYRNYLYARKDSVLWPSCLMRDLVFWSDMYLQTIDSGSDEDQIPASSSQPLPSSSSSSHLIEPCNGTTTLTEINGLLPPAETQMITLSKEKSNTSINCQGSLTKTRSCANLSSEFATLSTAPRARRRSSDPNFNDQSLIVSKHDCDLSDSEVSFFGNVVGHVNGFEETTSSNKQLENAAELDSDSELKENIAVTEGRLDLQPFLAIETSTDTIVEDAAMLATSADEHKSLEHANATKCRLEYDAECSLHASTSTTDISDSHVAVNRKACQQQHDAHSRRYVDLASLEKASGNRAVGFATAEQMDLVRQFLYFTPSTSTPGHSRTPSSGFPATPSDERPVDGGSARPSGGTNGVNGASGVSSVSSTSSSSSATGAVAACCLAKRLDVDGLPLLNDEVQQRLHDVLTEEQRRFNSLQHSLCLAKIALCQQVCMRCNASIHSLDHPEEVRSLPDSVGSGCGEVMSLGHAISNGNTSDVSWEQVEERDTRPTLWVPDHAVTRCMGCDSEFCIVRRKHHCRNCGKIFCADCSSQMTPIPNEQLYHPVRVCTFCFCELGGFEKEEFAAEQWIQRASVEDSE